MKKIDTAKIEKAVYEIIEALGDNPKREGLLETPARVARMYEEVFEGMNYKNEEIANMFNKCFDEESVDDLVVVKDIPIFSYCEHHIALMYNMKVHIAYLAHGKVIGLSKLARIADMVGKRLQLQERIGADIAEILSMILDTQDVMIVIEGEHSCMTARGIKSRGATTKTATLRGKFRKNSDLRREAYSVIG